MKKLLSILFLLSSPALAIDRPIPCTGNSCKLLFETTGSGGAKVSAGNIDGVGAVTLGPTSGATQVANTINGYSTLFTPFGNGTLNINNRSGSAATIHFGNSGAKTGSISSSAGFPFAVQDATNNDLVYVSSAGALTLGTTGGTQNHTVTGNLNLKSNVPGNIGSNNLAFFTASNAASQSCDSTCSTEPSGMNSSSGTCIKQWTNGGIPEVCSNVGTGKICLCAAVN